MVMPMAVGVHLPHERGKDVTSVNLSGGIGSYMVIFRNCDGTATSEHREEFVDVGGAISHRFGEGVELGLRGGYLNDHRVSLPVPVYGGGSDNLGQGVYYVNPHIAFEDEGIGAGIGVLLTDHSLYSGSFYEDNGKSAYPTAHLRVGNENKAYFATSLFENVPLYSGGGYFDIGVGVTHVPNKLGVFAGLSVGGPYDSGGLIVKTKFRPDPSFSMNANVRLGAAEGNTEYGLGLGVTYHFIHR